MSDKEKKVTGTTEEFTIQALSEEGAVMPDVEKTLVTDKKSTYVLLCSDGLYTELKGADIQKIIHSERTLEDKCEALVSLANKKGGHDNITAVLLEL